MLTLRSTIATWILNLVKRFLSDEHEMKTLGWELVRQNTNPEERHWIVFECKKCGSESITTLGSAPERDHQFQCHGCRTIVTADNLNIRSINSPAKVKNKEDRHGLTIVPHMLA
jgi:predicted RNA-binding Zn-ribbon protein involved in translation (DUF1610 family)